MSDASLIWFNGFGHGTLWATVIFVVSMWLMPRVAALLAKVSASVCPGCTFASGTVYYEHEPQCPKAARQNRRPRENFAALGPQTQPRNNYAALQRQATRAAEKREAIQKIVRLQAR
jgi:hypothetical protein